MEKVTVADGKYTICNDRGNLTALRNGEPWRRDLTGDNLVYWMMVEIQKLTAERDALAVKESQTRQVNDALHSDLEAAVSARDALRDKLNIVHSWIVCAAIASPEDMMQSAEAIEEVTRPEAA